jgi:hypothetical protein
MGLQKNTGAFVGCSGFLGGVLLRQILATKNRLNKTINTGAAVGCSGFLGGILLRQVSATKNHLNKTMNTGTVGCSDPTATPVFST